MTTVVVGAARGIGEAVAPAACHRVVGRQGRARRPPDRRDRVCRERSRQGGSRCRSDGRRPPRRRIDRVTRGTDAGGRQGRPGGRDLQPSPSLEVTRADLERILSVNTFGTFMVAQGYAREMVERGEGSIVAIGSIAARMPRMRQAAYCASKAAMRQALRVLALETVPRGVRINFVAPGPADTEMMRALQQDHSMADLWRGTPDGFDRRSWIAEWPSPRTSRPPSRSSSPRTPATCRSTTSMSTAARASDCDRAAGPRRHHADPRDSLP